MVSSDEHGFFWLGVMVGGAVVGLLVACLVRYYAIQEFRPYVLELERQCKQAGGTRVDEAGKCWSDKEVQR